MHPNRAFRFDSDAAMLDWAVARGFAHIFAVTNNGPMVVHAPIVSADEGSLRFHVARTNRITRLLDGARLTISVAGPDGYITPNWYADPGPSVPTWNFVAVEIEGIARQLDDDGLIEQLDTLAALHEPRVSPEGPWTRDKMDKERFRKMLTAIIAFEVTVEAVRGTCKLSQNKPDEDRTRVISGLARTGNVALADAMRGA